MEFKEYVQKRNEMLNSIGRVRGYCDGVDCIICHNLTGKDCFRNLENYNPERVEEIVQKWCDENPVMTNAQKFKEVFGTKPTNGTILSWICPPSYVGKLRCHEKTDCTTCKKWWDEEYKEPKKGGK